MDLVEDIKRVTKKTSAPTCVLTPPFPWDRPVVNEGDCSEKTNEVVVTLHGLWRSVRAMQPLANYLHEQGYTTVNVPYASFRHDLVGLVDLVMEKIRPWIDEGKRIHFVTHSLGGVVLKKLLDLLNQNDFEKVGRIVMLAPPHQGSEIVDWLHHSPMRPFKGVLGPAGSFLSTKNMGQEDDVLRAGVTAAVIMGKKSVLPFFKTLLDESNDGIISVDKGKLLGVSHFEVVDSDHTFIVSDRKIMEMTKSFIENGSI